jgi:hypothetical protein
VLSRVALAISLGIAATAHGEPRVEGVLGNGGVGARYLTIDEQMFVDVQATGELDRLSAGIRVGVTQVRALDVDHTIVAGIAAIRASAGAEALSGEMSTHTPLIARMHRRNHRFLGAYINDTVRFIRGLDITTGLVIEQWKNLGGDSTITYGSGPPMGAETPDTSVLLAPTLGAALHVTDKLSLVAQTARGVQEIGPSVTSGRFTAQARAFRSDELGTGVLAEASVQPAAPLLATIGYARTATHQRATTLLTLTDANIATVTARFDTDSQIDALLVRRIGRGVSAFVGVENLLDRRTGAEGGAESIDASPRLVHAGVRGYFATGTP